MTAAIYRITHVPSGRSYVGKSTNVKVRWHNIKAGLNYSAYRNKQMQEDWTRDGESAFKWEILEEFDPKDANAACERERQLIEVGPLSYNKLRQFGKPSLWTPERRSEHGAKYRGRTVSEETRKRMGEAQRRRKQTDQEKENHREATKRWWQGKTLEERRMIADNVREALKGRAKKE
jgi:group I intron endonuclease